MRVLIDSRGLQAQVHLEDGRRLGVFVSTLEQIVGCSMTFSTGSQLTGKELSDCDVLVVTTRYPREHAYSQAERTAVGDFVGDGGGLLLMSISGIIHRPWPYWTSLEFQTRLGTMQVTNVSNSAGKSHAAGTGLGKNQERVSHPRAEELLE